MRIRTPYDDLLNEVPDIGRLLLAFQALERAVKDCLGIMAAPSDHLGLLKSFTVNLTATRRVQLGQKISKHIAKLYGVSAVEFNGRYTQMFGRRSPEETKQDVAQAFAGLDTALATAARLLDYRNKLFHGEMKIEGDCVRFFNRGTLIASTPEEIEAKGNEVLCAVLGLYTSANSFRFSVEYLMRTEGMVANREVANEGDDH